MIKNHLTHAFIDDTVIQIYRWLKTIWHTAILIAKNHLTHGYIDY